MRAVMADVNFVKALIEQVNVYAWLYGRLLHAKEHLNDAI